MNRLILLLFRILMSSEVKLGVGEVSNSRCGVSGVALNASKPDENLSEMRGNRDEAMKSNHINHIGAEPFTKYACYITNPTIL